MNYIRKHDLLCRAQRGTLGSDWTVAEIDELLAENLVESKFVITSRGEEALHSIRHPGQTTYSYNPPHPLRGGPPQVRMETTPRGPGSEWVDRFYGLRRPPNSLSGDELVAELGATWGDPVSAPQIRRSAALDYEDIENRVMANLAESSRHAMAEPHAYVGVDVARTPEPGISPFITFDDLDIAPLDPQVAGRLNRNGDI